MTSSFASRPCWSAVQRTWYETSPFKKRNHLRCRPYSCRRLSFPQKTFNFSAVSTRDSRFCLPCLPCRQVSDSKTSHFVSFKSSRTKPMSSCIEMRPGFGKAAATRPTVVEQSSRVTVTASVDAIEKPSHCLHEQTRRYLLMLADACMTSCQKDVFVCIRPFSTDIDTVDAF